MVWHERKTPIHPLVLSFYPAALNPQRPGLCEILVLFEFFSFFPLPPNNYRLGGCLNSYKPKIPYQRSSSSIKICRPSTPRIITWYNLTINKIGFAYWHNFNLFLYAKNWFWQGRALYGSALDWISVSQRARPLRILITFPGYAGLYCATSLPSVSRCRVVNRWSECLIDRYRGAGFVD